MATTSILPTARSAKPAPISTADVLAAAAAHNSNPAYIQAGYAPLVSFRATIKLPTGEVEVEFNAAEGEELNRLVAIDQRARLAHRAGHPIRIERIAGEPKEPQRAVPAIVLDLVTVRQRLACFYAMLGDPSPEQEREWDELERRCGAAEDELDAAVAAVTGVKLSMLISAREG